MNADEEGRFHGVLPRPGKWNVSVVAEDLDLERELRKIEVEPSKITEVADLEIRIPATDLQGRSSMKAVVRSPRRRSRSSRRPR